jgi:hypothetical protein
MTAAIALGDITIHSVIEQQGTWFEMLEFSRRSSWNCLTELVVISDYDSAHAGQTRRQIFDRFYDETDASVCHALSPRPRPGASGAGTVGINLSPETAGTAG